MIHLLAFPHTRLTKAYESCAFTARTRTFAQMMGDEVQTYDGLVTAKERKAWWPWYSPSGQQVFNSFDPNEPGWAAYNSRATEAIRERMKPGDTLAITMGATHRPVAEALPDLVPVEVGVGYAGVWAPYRVYESWAWRHYLAGKAPTDDVRFFDAVIPRAYSVDDFPAGTGSGGYYLYMGRLMARKGPHVAADAVRRLGGRLVVAGQGVASTEPGKITCTDGTELLGDVEYVGVVGPAERAKLMGDATAILVPTLYLEPFGGVSVEAQLCGTPAVVSDWGGLPSNIIEGRTGFACNILASFAGAAAAAGSLDRTFIREHAQRTWGMDAIRPRFEAYFERLETLRDGRGGWYA